jgi:hypothetical protein
LSTSLVNRGTGGSSGWHGYGEAYPRSSPTSIHVLCKKNSIRFLPHPRPCWPTPRPLPTAAMCNVAEPPDLARFRGHLSSNRVVPSSTPNGRTQNNPHLHLGSNNEYKVTILSSFHTTKSLKNYLLQYQGSECDKMNSEDKINI